MTSRARVATSMLLALGLILGLGGCATQGTPPPPTVRVDEAVQYRLAAGIEYLQMGQPNEARQHIAKALELDPRSPAAHNAMALLYGYEGDLVNEEKHYKRALRLDPGYSTARNNYGILLYRQGHYQAALGEFQRVAEDPGYAGRAAAFENLGRSYRALGRKDEAFQSFSRALRLGRATESTLLELTQLSLERNDRGAARRYYGQYQTAVDQPSAAGLWVGIRLAAAEGDDDRQQTLSERLVTQFPESAERRAWQQWQASRTRSQQP